MQPLIKFIVVSFIFIYFSSLGESSVDGNTGENSLDGFAQDLMESVSLSYNDQEPKYDKTIYYTAITFSDYSGGSPIASNCSNGTVHFPSYDCNFNTGYLCSLSHTHSLFFSRFLSFSFSHCFKWASLCAGVFAFYMLEEYYYIELCFLREPSVPKCMF